MIVGFEQEDAGGGACAAERGHECVAELLDDIAGRGHYGFACAAGDDGAGDSERRQTAASRLPMRE